MAKKAAQKGDGPWGEAIQYWLKELKLRQSHIVEGTGMAANKVSRAANGLNVRPDTLRGIAEFFGVPLESVLVSPVRRLSSEETRRVAEQVAEKTTMHLSALMDHQRAAAMPRIDPRLIAIAKRIAKLPPGRQKSVLQLIAEYERSDRPKQPRHAAAAKKKFK